MTDAGPVRIDGMETIGERVRRTRERRGLSQTALAKSAGITKEGISAIERGGTKNPRPTTLYAIADALGVSDRWLANGGKEPKVQETEKPYGISEQDWQILQALKGLTPSQREEEWRRIQTIEQQNREIIEGLGHRQDKTGG